MDLTTLHTARSAGALTPTLYNADFTQILALIFGPQIAGASCAAGAAGYGANSATHFGFTLPTATATAFGNGDIFEVSTDDGSAIWHVIHYTGGSPAKVNQLDLTAEKCVYGAVTNYTGYSTPSGLLIRRIGCVEMGVTQPRITTLIVPINTWVATDWVVYEDDLCAEDFALLSAQVVVADIPGATLTLTLTNNNSGSQAFSFSSNVNAPTVFGSPTIFRKPSGAAVQIVTLTGTGAAPSTSPVGAIVLKLMYVPSNVGA
jgi:hypothetical protein